MTINDRIKELDIILPQAKPPVGSYVATKITGATRTVIGKIKYLKLLTPSIEIR